MFDHFAHNMKNIIDFKHFNRRQMAFNFLFLLTHNSLCESSFNKFMLVIIQLHWYLFKERPQKHLPVRSVLLSHKTHKTLTNWVGTGSYQYFFRLGLEEYFLQQAYAGCFGQTIIKDDASRWRTHHPEHTWLRSAARGQRRRWSGQGTDWLVAVTTVCLYLFVS